MSRAGAVTSPIASRLDAPPRRRFWRPSTLAIAMLFTLALLYLALHVINAGFVRADIAALQAGEAWRTGGWLSQLVLRAVSLIRDTGAQQVTLSLLVAAVSGIFFSLLYFRLRENGWLVFGAWAVVIAVVLHAGALFTFTASSRAVPLYVAFAALIPAIRSLEDIGDVQAAIGMSLVLPLLLLVGPVTTLLIVPLALGAALADPDGRRDPRAFTAMLLVAVLPTIIVVLGIVGFIVQARLELADALLPYVRAYTEFHFGDVVQGLAAYAVFAPVLLVPLLYCVWPSLPERRHVFSALAVVVLPLYLAVARCFVSTMMTQMTPALALIAAFVSWLAVVRLPIGLRIVSLALLAVSVVASWTQTGLWDDPTWKAALFSLFGPPAG